MGYESRGEGSGSAAAVTVVLAVLVFLGLAAAGGGAWIYTRAQVARQHAMMAQEQAMVAERMARLEAERAAQSQAESATLKTASQQPGSEAADPPPEADPNIISIAADGRLQMDGQAFTKDELLKALRSGKPAAIRLEPDRNCPVAWIDDVCEICRQAEVATVQLKIAGGTVTVHPAR